MAKNSIDCSPWVAYVGPFGFPDGGAAARRVLGNAQSLVEAGYRVVIASGQKPEDLRESEVRQGINVVSLGERTAEHWPSALKRFKYAAMGRRTRDWLGAQEQPPSAVILYSGYSPYLLRLIPWCRRMKIPLIFDAVEWYEASGMLGPLGSPYQWNIELAMRWLLKKTDGVIAISSYLSSYYREARLPVIKIPPTLATSEIPVVLRSQSHTPLQLCYAGIPTTNKDLISVVIEAVLSLDEEGRQIELHIAGPTERELLNLPSLAACSGALPPCIRSHGRLSHRSAMELVQSSHFSVLLRRDHRVSRAGFSTKFVESLALGTPVIGNITGDLGDFLVDRETGLVCDGWTPKELQSTLNRALSMSSNELEDMRHRSQAVAASRFDTHVYSQELGKFIRAVSD